MKFGRTILLAVLGLVLFVPFAFSQGAVGGPPASYSASSTPGAPPASTGVPDYQSMTNEQLCMNDPTFSTACTEEQRAAFQREWDRRLAGMTPAEREKYLGLRESMRQRYGAGIGSSGTGDSGGGSTGDYFRRDFQTESEARKLGAPPVAGSTEVQQRPMTAPSSQAPVTTAPRAAAPMTQAPMTSAPTTQAPMVQQGQPPVVTVQPGTPQVQVTPGTPKVEVQPGSPTVRVEPPSGPTVRVEPPAGSTSTAPMSSPR